MVNLRDQLLKAGLVNQKEVKQVNHDKTKEKKEERRTGVEAVDETRLAAQEIQRQNAEKAREANAQRDAAAAQKALQAQITQLVNLNRQSKGKGKFEEVAYNFTYLNKIERIYVSPEVQGHLVAGRLAIVMQGETAELVPRAVADKIAERDASIVVRVNKASTEVEADDPYADFQIPDDFTW